MCEAGEDYGGCRAPPGRPRVSSAQKCMKCKEGAPVLVIRVGDAFCKACFREYFVHKFRAMLGKNRVIFPGEKVLLALSGGPSSSSMLRQVQEGLSRETAKRLRFVPGVIYVDEGAVCKQSPGEREDTLTQMQALLQASGFPHHLIHLEEVFKLPSSILQRVPHAPSPPESSYKVAVEGFIHQQRRGVAGTGDTVAPEGQVQERLAVLSMQEGAAASPGGLLPDSALTEELRRLFGAVTTLTAKEELLQMLRTHLILHTARTQGYSKVMMGDSCTRVAVKLLTNLSLGRGAFLALDTGFMDDRHGDVVVVRPMREYTAKEVAFYNRLFGVPTVFMPALDTKVLEKPSIHRLVERFLYALQAEFPSTVSTVYRTGEKLSATLADTTAKPEHCLLCLCVLDTSVVEGSTLQALLISEELSQKRPLDLPPARGGCCAGAGAHRCCGSPPASGTRARADFLPLLCYGCRLTIKDMTCLEPLPPYIWSEAERRRRRAAIKQEIQEYLLEDEAAEPKS
ncbi:PREDICTED: cytoplasmic tRNA 2-thiolation protein 2 isoform X2 [Crocodylus porosus]|uniref:cytoplasmic tRNA 2-thiolation protein 2 isoform X2 n=1 Tax=Crocodylus porosus TaxID=8502 RepID=UPI00093A9329|nr:PREDICTED: cytoplasmic tRNA 2-thiolation protein 2 isoform X2 [Crocodylus porosus]